MNIEQDLLDKFPEYENIIKSLPSLKSKNFQTPSELLNNIYTIHYRYWQILFQDLSNESKSIITSFLSDEIRQNFPQKNLPDSIDPLDQNLSSQEQIKRDIFLKIVQYVGIPPDSGPFKISNIKKCGAIFLNLISETYDIPSLSAVSNLQWPSNIPRPPKRIMEKAVVFISRFPKRNPEELLSLFFLLPDLPYYDVLGIFRLETQNESLENNIFMIDSLKCSRYFDPILVKNLINIKDYYCDAFSYLQKSIPG